MVLLQKKNKQKQKTTCNLLPLYSGVRCKLAWNRLFHTVFIDFVNHFKSKFFFLRGRPLLEKTEHGNFILQSSLIAYVSIQPEYRGRTLAKIHSDPHHRLVELESNHAFLIPSLIEIKSLAFRASLKQRNKYALNKYLY